MTLSQQYQQRWHTPFSHIPGNIATHSVMFIPVPRVLFYCACVGPGFALNIMSVQDRLTRENTQEHFTHSWYETNEFMRNLFFKGSKCDDLQNNVDQVNEILPRRGPRVLGFFVCLFVCLFVCFCIQGHTHGIWRFPGQGSNQSCSHQPTPQPQQRQI